MSTLASFSFLYIGLCVGFTVGVICAGLLFVARAAQEDADGEHQ